MDDGWMGAVDAADVLLAGVMLPISKDVVSVVPGGGVEFLGIRYETERSPISQSGGSREIGLVANDFPHRNETRQKNDSTTAAQTCPNPPTNQGDVNEAEGTKC